MFFNKEKNSVYKNININELEQELQKLLDNNLLKIIQNYDQFKIEYKEEDFLSIEKNNNDEYYLKLEFNCFYEDNLLKENCLVSYIDKLSLLLKFKKQNAINLFINYVDNNYVFLLKNKLDKNFCFYLSVNYDNNSNSYIVIYKEIPIFEIKKKENCNSYYINYLYKIDFNVYDDVKINKHIFDILADVKLHYYKDLLNLLKG